MAKKGNRILIRVANKTSGTHYTTYKNRINSKDKVKIKKYDPKTRKHEIFEEVKLS